MCSVCVPCVPSVCLPPRSGSELSLSSSPVCAFFQKRRENVCQSLNIETPETSYVDILQRLVRRYLFKLERQKLENDGEYVRLQLTIIL